MDLADALFSTPAMSAVFATSRQVRYMLAFEAELAHAQARLGLIPVAAAEAIEAACSVDRFDLADLCRAAVPAASPAVPLVRELTARVVGEAKRYVHLGATSQDAIDTALVLQMRDGFDLLESDLLTLADMCAALADAHRHTVMAGRTLLQQAVPVTFGLKAARWLALILRQLRALRALRPRVLVVQLGGAAGTLAALGERGLDVVDELAAKLGLGAPDLPWHTERDRIGEVASRLALLASALGKVALDLSLLAQTEVGEVAESAAPGKGASTAMPQKRNPVDAVEALAAVRLAVTEANGLLAGLVQEHERAIGAWQAEWSMLPNLFRWTSGALAHVRAALVDLEVDTDRMRANLEQTRGLSMAESLTTALAATVGREAAHELVQAATRRVASSGRTLADIARQDGTIASALSGPELERALEPAAYLGSTDRLIDRALASYRHEGGGTRAVEGGR
jgi:3-carboxy-cis,cis-muconate cycloisomerase